MSCPLSGLLFLSCSFLSVFLQLFSTFSQIQLCVSEEIIFCLYLLFRSTLTTLANRKVQICMCCHISINHTLRDLVSAPLFFMHICASIN